MRLLWKILRNTLIGLIIFAVALTGFFKVVHYPNPVATIKLGLAPASKTPTLLPWHVVAPSTNPITLPTSTEAMPATIEWLGKTITWQEFLDASNTNAFLVIRNGVLTYEYYNAKKGITATTQLPSYSVAKTLTSIIAGQLIAQGKLKESDKFVDYFPEYKTGTSFDQVTVQSLLDMQSGVGVSDNYPTGPQGWGVAIAQMYATTDMNWFIKHNRKMAFTPDTKALYRSVDPQLLGMIIHRITGMRISDYFSKNVWQPVGAATAATWNVDHVGGIEKTFCCFNASARDYAKVGLMLLNNGNTAASHIVSADWLKRLSTPVVKLDNGWGYSAYMWHPYPGINMMLGLHGQFVFMNPATKTVIVKLSDNPTGNDPDVAEARVLYQLSQK
jgi:CubicO group peptidase (beta-lactamase class C family)